MEALVFAATSFKIIDFLRINDYIKLFFQTVDVGVTTNVMYMILILPSFLFFSIVAHIMWGPYHYEFSSVSNSYIQILLFSLGNINFSKLLRTTPHFFLIYMLSFLLLQLFFLSTVLVCLFAEKFRQTVRSIGYPEDIQIKQWTLKDYVIWLCYFIEFENERK
jgi:hypothetical protein